MKDYKRALCELIENISKKIDDRLKCIYHLQSSFRGKLDRQHLKMRIYLKTAEKYVKNLQKRCRRNYQRELKRRKLLIQMLERA